MYTIYRILGNDLPPRHSETQTLDNLKFILQHEPNFPGVDKIFLINRVVDHKLVKTYTNLIESYGYKHLEIPFYLVDYRACGNDLEKKVQYITNVNNARNFCLQHFKMLESLVCLPLDGGSFFRQDGWDGFTSLVECNSNDGYYLIPQSRASSYDDALNGLPIIKEEYIFPDGSSKISLRELAIAFNYNADLTFDESLRYGKVDKVELLWKLGVPGIWDYWEPELRKKALEKPSKFYKQCKMNGFLIRLPSGDPEGDSNSQIRGKNRMEGLRNLLKRLN